MVADELERVSVLEELGEQEHSNFRLAGPDPPRGLQAVVAVPWRHLDVRDHHVRPMGGSLPDQVVGVPGHADHVEARVLENVHDPFTNERLILAHYDSDRSLVVHGGGCLQLSISGSRERLGWMWGFPRGFC
jgi:hypothetical protein